MTRTITLTLDEWETENLLDLVETSVEVNGTNDELAPNGQTWEQATQAFAEKIEAALA